MKKIRYLFLIITTVLQACTTKENGDNFNFSFEIHEKGLPTGWDIFGNADYPVYLDSTVFKDGKISVSIESKEGEAPEQYKIISFNLPDNYDGKEITLSGYIKTENVTEGYAGLCLRIDPRIGFNYMDDKGVTGTTDWTKYEISLPLKPSETKLIVVGAIFTGKGKMWIDDMQVKIGGKDISRAKIYKEKTLPAQNDKEFDSGSGITFPEVDETLINNLELLGRIWGFLKYHHPGIASEKGRYNWDYELFRILPEYVKTTDNGQRDELLIRWIDKYGKIRKCKSCEKNPEDAYIKPDHTWIENSDISSALKKQLMKIYDNRHQGEQYYIRMTPIENPVFTNENDYAHLQYPDAGFRLLSLYRYWNMVYYFFPSTYMTDKDWNTVLREYIPLFVSAKDELKYELAALRLIGEINDTHAVLWGADKVEKSKGNWYPPFKVKFIENKLVVTQLYDIGEKSKNNISQGDIITKIRGKDIQSIVDSLKVYFPASNESSQLRDIASNILRSGKPITNIEYISSGVKKEIIIHNYTYEEVYNYLYGKQDDTSYKLLDNNIGYITLANIKEEHIPLIKEDFKNTKGIIIDIRNYPSTFVVFSLGSYFVSESTPFVKFTSGNINNPGEFLLKDYDHPLPKPEETYKGKLIVLVNEESQSQAEYTAMAFRAGRNTTIIGSTTAGADGNVSEIVLPGGLKTLISGLGVYYPDGSPTQRVGIIPDIVVTPTINGIKNNRDELLERAIEEILKNSDR